MICSRLPLLQTWQLIRTFSPNKRHHRSFQQQGIGIPWDISQEPSEGLFLSSVFPEITGIEELPSLGLDQERIGIEGGMINQIWLDREGGADALRGGGQDEA